MTKDDKPGRQYNSGHFWGLPEQSPGGPTDEDAYLVISETLPDTWASQEKCERVGADTLGQRSRIPMLSKASCYGSQEGGIVVYTLLYLKWITSTDLLYSTWNFAQCCMAAWMQGGWGRMCTYIYMCIYIYGWVPLLSTWNYHNIVNRLCMRGWVLAKALQLCPTLCDSMDCSPPGSSVHEILQARILECVTMPSSISCTPIQNKKFKWKKKINC